MVQSAYIKTVEKEACIAPDSDGDNPENHERNFELNVGSLSAYVRNCNVRSVNRKSDETFVSRERYPRS